MPVQVRGSVPRSFASAVWRFLCSAIVDGLGCGGDSNAGKLKLVVVISCNAKAVRYFYVHSFAPKNLPKNIDEISL